MVSNWLSRGTALGQFGMSVGEAVLFYLGIALMGSLVATLFGDWATTRLRGAIVGFGGGVLAAFVVNVVLLPRILPSPLAGMRLVIYLAVIGLMPGAYVGALYWSPPEAESD